MKKTAEHSIMTTFLLELVLAMAIPFIVWWSLTPTNVLNSGRLPELLEDVGISGSILMFFAGIPAGIIGIRAAKRNKGKGRIPTLVLSILNLSVGAIEVLITIIIFCAVAIGGVSV